MSQVCLFNFIGVNTVITDFFVYNIIKMVDEVEIRQCRCVSVKRNGADRGKKVSVEK